MPGSSTWAASSAAWMPATRMPTRAHPLATAPRTGAGRSARRRCRAAPAARRRCRRRGVVSRAGLLALRGLPALERPQDAGEAGDSRPARRCSTTRPSGVEACEQDDGDDDVADDRAGEPGASRRRGRRAASRRRRRSRRPRRWAWSAVAPRRCRPPCGRPAGRSGRRAAASSSTANRCRIAPLAGADGAEAATATPHQSSSRPCRGR